MTGLWSEESLFTRLRNKETLPLTEWLLTLADDQAVDRGDLAAD